jgi:hypothetical protein
MSCRLKVICWSIATVHGLVVNEDMVISSFVSESEENGGASLDVLQLIYPYSGNTIDNEWWG